MILGNDTDDNAWIDLIRSPGAPEAWEQAADRRNRVDRLARLIHGREWLAGALLQARRTFRQAVAPAGGPSFTMGRSFVELTLGAREVPVRWGAQEVIEVALGDEIRPTGAGVRVFYRNAGGAGLLKAGWRMEPGDAPVLLVAVLDPDARFATAEEALDAGVARALLILVERSGENA